MSEQAKAAVARHVAHDIRECDCGPFVILLTLQAREAAEWISDNAETLERLGRFLGTATDEGAL